MNVQRNNQHRFGAPGHFIVMRITNFAPWLRAVRRPAWDDADSRGPRRSVVTGTSAPIDRPAGMPESQCKGGSLRVGPSRAAASPMDQYLGVPGSGRLPREQGQFSAPPPARSRPRPENPRGRSQPDARALPRQGVAVAWLQALPGSQVRLRLRSRGGPHGP